MYEKIVCPYCRHKKAVIRKRKAFCTFCKKENEQFNFKEPQEEVQAKQTNNNKTFFAKVKSLFKKGDENSNV